MPLARSRVSFRAAVRRLRPKAAVNSRGAVGPVHCRYRASCRSIGSPIKSTQSTRAATGVAERHDEVFRLRDNRPLRTNAVASNSPIRRRISVSLKWSKRVGSRGDVVAGRFFPDAIRVDSVVKVGFITMNNSYAVHVAPPSDDDHAALRTFRAPNVRSPCFCLKQEPGLGRLSPR